MVGPGPDGWRLDRYDLPALRPVSSYPLAAGSSEQPALAVPDGEGGGPVLTRAGNLLSAVDPASGRPAGVGATISGAAGPAEFWSRPGHPGQVAVVDREGTWTCGTSSRAGRCPRSS